MRTNAVEARRRGPARLQLRLFLWFLATIAAAAAANALTVVILRTADPTPSPPRALAATIAARVASDWDDPRACEAYLARVHETVGWDLHLRRDPAGLPRQVFRQADRGHVFAFDGQGQGYIPIARGGHLVGAAQFDAPQPPSRMLQAVAALLVALLVLALAARAVSRRLADPLEAIAGAANRFGGGDLAARVGHRARSQGAFSSDEVGGVARAFDLMAERIEGVVREQRELLGAISHELRSPLGRARVALEIARERAGEASAASAPLREVERQLGEVDLILGDLLAAARTGLADLQMTPTPIVPWLRARIVTEPSAPPIELVLEEEEHHGGLIVKMEASLMNRALHNLFANARAHGHPRDLPLEVLVDATASRVRVAVRDRGPGFPEQILPRAFDPFVKGDPARTPGHPGGQAGGGGSGLGLALVRRIVEAHGGAVFARNLHEGAVAPSPRTTTGTAGAEAARPTGAEVGFELPR